MMTIAEQAYSPAVEKSTHGRLFFIDHLRVFLSILVIIHHLAITYGAVSYWYYVEVPKDIVTPLVTVLIILLNQAYFMGCFFLIAGYFVAGSYERKGFRNFLRDRLLRLGLPILAFMFLMSPIISYAGYISIAPALRRGSSLSFVEFLPISIGPGPLWFLEALLILSIVYAFWRHVGNRKQPNEEARTLPKLPHIVLFTILLGIITFLWRIWVPIGYYVPIIGFPSASHLPQYVSLFMIGIYASRRAWFEQISTKSGRLAFAVAFLATLFIFPFALGQNETAFLGGINIKSLAYSFWEAIFCINVGIGLIGLFHKRLNHQWSISSFLAQNSYAAYIIHTAVIVALAIALKGLELHALLKFGLSIIIGVPLCFLSAALIRKIPGFGAIL